MNIKKVYKPLIHWAFWIGFWMLSDFLVNVVARQFGIADFYNEYTFINLMINVAAAELLCDFVIDKIIKYKRY